MSICNPLASGSALTGATLSTAIGSSSDPDCGGNKVLLLTPGTWAITGNLTIPDRLAIHVPQGALFSITGGMTLTLDCRKIRAGDWQIFSGPGVVACSNGGQLSALWFGTVLTGATLSDVSTMTSGDLEILVPPGAWVISSNLTLPDRLGLRIPVGTTITVNAGVTLTLDCRRVLSVTQAVFAGTGTVTCSNVPYTVTFAASITFAADTAPMQVVTLTGNITAVALTRGETLLRRGGVLWLRFTQDGTGGRTVGGWPASVRWAGGTAPTITTTASRSDLIGLLFDGVNWWEVGLRQNLF